MNQPFSIVPPPDLAEEWRMDYMGRGHAFIDVATKAAQWGSDQELEACLKHLFQRGFFDADILCLRAARRPKPPSLKEQALALVEQHEEGWRPSPKDWDTIRRALEALDA
jgi:hypothetical protein